MKLRQAGDFSFHICKCARNILCLVSFKCTIGRERLIELSQQSFVVEDESELLFLSGLLEETVYARNRLQQRVFPQRLAHIQHRVTRGIEAGEQFGDNNKDLWITTTLERIYDLPIVLFFRIIEPLHHLVPELADHIF
jgi:hypothetical protein